MVAGNGQESQGGSGGLPGPGGGGGRRDDGLGVGEGGGDARHGAGLEVFYGLVAADGEEAGEGVLAHGAGPAHGARDGAGVEVGQHRARPGVGPHAAGLLAGVLDGEEHRLSGRAAGPVEGIEQQHRAFGQGLGGVGEPVRRQGAALFEAGSDQVHHLMEGRGQGHLGRSDRRLAGVGRLEDAGVEDDLSRGGRSLRAQAQAKVVVARQRSGETGHRRGHPLVAGDHHLDGPLLGGQQLGQHGGFAPGHSPSLSHGGDPQRPIPTAGQETGREGFRRFTGV